MERPIEKPSSSNPKSSEKRQPKFTATHRELEEARERIALKERELEMREGLPFLYGWKWYPWAREFFESTNKLNFLCAANQISKSSSQIRKCIDWATNQAKWPALWVNKPIQFWYLYPTGNQARIEFETKWTQFLPKGKFKDDPVYGWKAEYKANREIFAIHFFSGVHVYFKTYAQDSQALQTGTCDAVFCDEELPEDLYGELIFRISASDGYFHMVFTATLGQEFWRLVIDPGQGEEEKLPGAFKQTVSMYDCLLYEDGSPSHWTHDKIQVVINRCQNENEVLKRVYGKFLRDSGGKKYEQYDMKRHMKPGHPIPKGWMIFAGIDSGSGGTENHPSAIVFVAVDPEFRKGRVFRAWRGDRILTSAGDVVQKYVELREQYKVVAAYYDWGDKDLETIAGRMNVPVQKAEKSHEVGEQILNTLFKNDMLLIYEDPEMQKLSIELSILRKDTPKRTAKDDLADALRYAVTRIPWDWSVITGDLPDGVYPAKKPKTYDEQQIEDRRAAFVTDDDSERLRIEEEFREANDLYGN